MEKSDKLIQQIQLYMEHKLARDRAIAAMEEAKEKVFGHMRDSDESVVRAPFDDSHDIKVSLRTAGVKRFDKEGLAEELSVGASAVTRDFLLKSIDERKLTFEQYESFNHLEWDDKISIRLVKVESK